MDYQEIKNLIDSTLQGKEYGHEITPLEHQNMIMAVLEYAHQINVVGQSIVNGFAKNDTFPATPDNAKLAYIAACKSETNTVFESFVDVNGNPITVSCPENVNKFVLLLWNIKYWEKLEQSPEMSVLNGDFNEDFNADFNDNFI